jgi:hypothetical protein
MKMRNIEKSIRTISSENDRLIEMLATQITVTRDCYRQTKEVFGDGSKQAGMLDNYLCKLQTVQNIMKGVEQ